MTKPSLTAIEPPTPESIAKPGKVSLDKFKSKPTPAGLDKLENALPHHNIAQAKDFVRLHSNEATHWSPELCFVSVPVKGTKRDMLHLIDEEVAARNNVRVVQRFRLALATKPYDAFFLCHVPTRNTDNSWNWSNLMACEQAKTLWTQAVSRKEENKDSYAITTARNPEAFPDPKWPAQPLDELITITFAGCMIEQDDHPGLLRLIGDKQNLA